MILKTTLSLQIFAYLLRLQSLSSVSSEQYTSVDELGSWSRETAKFIEDLDNLVHLEEVRLAELKQARESLIPLKEEVESRTLVDPVHIFVTLNRLKVALEVIDKETREHSALASLNDENEIDSNDDESDDTRPDLKYGQLLWRVQEDLEGSGSALLRLQAFYGLNITHLIKGNVVPEGPASFRMTANDCFELGRIAYHEEQYGPAIVWLYASLEMVMFEKDASDEPHSFNSNHLIDDILDHMAFAAYKLGLLKYSAELTKAWLHRDPNNERARENLDYYLDELARNPSERIDAQEDGGDHNRVKQMLNEHEKHVQNFKNLPLDKYLVQEDEIVRMLCRQTQPPANTLNKCKTGPVLIDGSDFYPGVRLETLNEKPKIVRVHDIISRKEAEHLQQLSRPKLQRSTIMLSAGQQISKFRIAKTAWLKSDVDPVVDRVERRLATILGVGLENSEHLQVVNYGLGGFYGPHLDSARASNANRDDSVLINQLQRSDRYATILIYLNGVEAGGSTVFPLLNLTVTPIARSAVVWFNILEDGYSDDRTLHTGCPVSLGSKWVAVKWPREEANSFHRGNKWWM